MQNRSYLRAGVLLVLAVAMLVSACGKKGPLYLPEPSSLIVNSR